MHACRFSEISDTEFEAVIVDIKSTMPRNWGKDGCWGTAVTRHYCSTYLNSKNAPKDRPNQYNYEVALENKVKALLCPGPNSLWHIGMFK